MTDSVSLSSQFLARPRWGSVVDFCNKEVETVIKILRDASAWMAKGQKSFGGRDTVNFSNMNKGLETTAGAFDVANFITSANTMRHQYSEGFQEAGAKREFFKETMGAISNFFGSLYFFNDIKAIDLGKHLPSVAGGGFATGAYYLGDSVLEDYREYHKINSELSENAFPSEKELAAAKQLRVMFDGASHTANFAFCFMGTACVFTGLVATNWMLTASSVALAAKALSFFQQKSINQIEGVE